MVFGLQAVRGTQTILSHSDLLEWQMRLKDVHYDCPVPKETDETSQFIMSVVDCSDEAAIFRYDYKVKRQQNGLIFILIFWCFFFIVKQW